MAGFNFSALNNNFVFDLPEGLWDKQNFIKVDEAHAKYGDEIIPVIAFGIVKIDKEKHPDAVSDKSAWIATEDELISIPSFQLSDVEMMLKSEEAVEACKSGLMGVRFDAYDCKYGRHVKAVWCNR